MQPRSERLGRASSRPPLRRAPRPSPPWPRRRPSPSCRAGPASRSSCPSAPSTGARRSRVISRPTSCARGWGSPGAPTARSGPCGSWTSREGTRRSRSPASTARPGRSLARGRFEHARRRAPDFSSGDEWAVTWFDAEGLAYARPRWETNPPVGDPARRRNREGGQRPCRPRAAPGGALVAAAPFGPERHRLGVFQFAPVDPAQPQLKAVGVTRSAKKPRWPTVAADASGGYLVAWQDEEDGSIRASRFDAAGREGNAHVVAKRQGGDRPAGAAQETPDRDQRLGLVATGSAGALLVWSEGATLIARALDAEARPRGAPWVVGKGKWRALAPSGDGALVRVGRPRWQGGGASPPREAGRRRSALCPRDSGCRMGCFP